MSANSREQKDQQALPGVDPLHLQQVPQPRAQSPKAAIPVNATAAADAELSSLSASPKQTPPAKARRQESPPQRSQIAPWPPNPNRPPPLPEEPNTSVLSADQQLDQLLQDQSQTRTSSSTRDDGVAHEPLLPIRTSDELEEDQEHVVQDNASVIHRLQVKRLTRYSRDRNMTSQSNAMASASAAGYGPNAMASASAASQEQQGFFFGAPAGEHQLAMQREVAAATEQQAQENNRFWEGQMTIQIQRAQAAEAEIQALREEMRLREIGFRQAAAAYQHEAMSTADRYEAVTATLNANAEARADAAENRAAQSRETLVQTREEARRSHLQHEQEHQAQELRTNQLKQEATAHIQHIAQEAHNHVQHHFNISSMSLRQGCTGKLPNSKPKQPKPTHETRGSSRRIANGKKPQKRKYN